jgi:hypothetical protein
MATGTAIGKCWALEVAAAVSAAVCSDRWVWNLCEQVSALIRQHIGDAFVEPLPCCADERPALAVTRLHFAGRS